MTMKLETAKLNPDINVKFKILTLGLLATLRVFMQIIVNTTPDRVPETNGDMIQLTPVAPTLAQFIF